MAAFMYVSAEAAQAHSRAMELCLSKSADLGEVEQAFRAVLDLEPRHPDAACNLGVILTRLGRPAEAVEFLKRALRVKPGLQEAQVSLSDALTMVSTALVEQGRIVDAIAPAMLATEVWPAHAEAHFSLGVALHLANEPIKAVHMYRTALLLDMAGNTGGTDSLASLEPVDASTTTPPPPEHWASIRLPPPAKHERRLSDVLRARAWNNIGIALQAMQRLPEAEESLLTAIALQPGFVEARSNLGLVLVDLGRLFEAEEAYRTALAISPEALQPMNNLGVLLREQGKIADAIDLYARCVRMRGAHERNPLHNLVYGLNFCPDTPITDVQRRHIEFAGMLQALVGSPYNQWPWFGPLTDDRRITIGFVSPDFYRHSVAYFLDAPVRCLDKKRFRLVAFVNDNKHDGVSERLAAHFDAWHRIFSIPGAREVAELVRSEKVDILIDLTGHTAKNRLDVFALQPAPVQATWIGYPNTTGLSTVQYRICDAVTDPDSDERRRLEPNSEKIVRIDPCFLCYTPLDGCDENGVVPVPAPLPNLHERPVVGSFNAMAKLSSRTVRVWCRFLTANPSVRVFIKSRVFVCKKTAELTRARFAANGVSHDRVELVPFTAGRAEHLVEYNRLALALDCFPYSGTTTTCEALLMSVPVVTLLGQCHRQNVTASILRASGLPELVAESEDAFVQLATDLIRDPERLARYRATVRDRFLASDMTNADQYTAKVAALFESMYAERRGQLDSVGTDPATD